MATEGVSTTLTYDGDISNEESETTTLTYKGNLELSIVEFHQNRVRFRHSLSQNQFIV